MNVRLRMMPNSQWIVEAKGLRTLYRWLACGVSLADSRLSLERGRRMTFLSFYAPLDSHYATTWFPRHSDGLKFEREVRSLLGQEYLEGRDSSLSMEAT